MKNAGRTIDQVADSEAVGDQGVGDQPPMAAPPESLGAHDRQMTAGFRPSLEIGQGVPERVRIHMRGVRCEGG